MADLKLGIIGTGRIANRFVMECGQVAGISTVAVYNPHFDSAERFGHKHSLEAYPELEGFFGAVDAVYIASPHDTHMDYTMKALEAGKHVICEKPMSFSREDLEAAFEIAEAKGLVLMEGFKTFYCPGFDKVISLVEEGVIGNLVAVDACFTKLVPEDSRELMDLEYGGSLTELGSYVLLPIVVLFGPDISGWDTIFDSAFGKNGLDLYTKISVMTKDGRMGTATCGLGVKSDGRLCISGTKGYILVPSPWWLTKHIEVHYEDPSQVDCYDTEFAEDGLRYEIGRFVDAIRGNGSAQALLADARQCSLAIATVMEEFLRERN